MKLMIVGNTGGADIGGSLLRVASELGLEAHLVESRVAMEASPWLRRFNWWLRGRRPTWLGRFSSYLLDRTGWLRPSCLLTTGFAPCHKRALQEIGALGIRRLNYLTDDPFNPSQRAPWFLETLPFYDHVFSPRWSNMNDLLDLGCQNVSYLPFAYDPELFYAETLATPEEESRFASDVMFAGGADCERIPYIAALIQAGFQVALYGDYWERFPETHLQTCGHADPQMLRKATGAAKVALCLVRRANRDGHVMRTFEIPAVGACMLTEDTQEHREIFGEEGKAVVYFRTVDQMVSKLRWLLDHDEERQRLAAAAHTLIVNGRNTYKDRLISMLAGWEA